MTEKTYPPHYTETDITHIERIKAWMAEKKYKQAELARLARVATSTFSQILSGSYITSPSNQLVAVISAMRSAEETNNDSTPAVETSVYKLAHQCCEMARRYHNFSVLSGFVGVGKTFALKRYVATRPNTYLIEATPTMTPSSLVKLLARKVVGCDVKGSIADRFDSVVDALRNTDSLLIVDEAETLTPRQLHTLRRLRDLANIGILLSGTEFLKGMLKPEHGQFDQIRSRCGYWSVTITCISADDAAALVQSHFGAEEVPDEVVTRLYQYSKGSARMLSEGLIAGIKAFRKGNSLSVKMVDEIAKRVLCLQSIA